MKQKAKQKQILIQRIKYKARAGAPFKVEDAQAIGEEIEQLPVKQPRTIVEKARNPNTILHNYFDWNDSVAGEKWRLQQARNIVNHIIEIKVIQGEEHEIKSFFPVFNEQKENVYVTNVEAVTNHNYRRQLLADMKVKLENLIKLIDVFSSLEE